MEQGRPRTAEETDLLRKIKSVNDRKTELEQEADALHREGKINEMVRKRRAIEEARRYLNILCAKHRKKFYKPYFRIL